MGRSRHDEPQAVRSPPGRSALLSGLLLGAAGVALGAFAAHGLGGRLDPVRIGWWQTAVQYQMWHAAALVALGALADRRMDRPATLLGGGTMLFAGTLYLMALTGWRWLGMVTPLGGLAMIAGWLLAAWRLVRL